MQTNPSYNILSLDGGGSWALLQAQILGDIFGPTTPGLQILNRFNTVVANSGGSIVAALLACNQTPEQIAAYFLNNEKRRQAFTPAKFSWRNKVLGFFKVGYKYDTPAKLKAINQHLPKGEMLMSDLAAHLGNTELIILSYDYHSHDGKFFKTGNKNGTSKTWEAPTSYTLAQAVHASANAPLLFFKDPAQVGKNLYWDGATAGFNNPVMVGVTEALAAGTDPKQLQVLTIGTSSNRLPIVGRSIINGVDYAQNSPDYFVTDLTHKDNRRPDGDFGAFTRDLKKLAGCITTEPPTWATYSAYLASGHTPNDTESARFFRLNPMVQPILNELAKRWELPKGLTKEEFVTLNELGMDAVDQTEVELIKKLGSLYLQGHIPNQPIQAGTNFKTEIGTDRYTPQVKAAINKAFTKAKEPVLA